MIKKTFCLLIFRITFLNTILFAQNYPLDSTFAESGKAIVDITSVNIAQNHIATQSDGKIVFATSKVKYNNGYDYDFCLLRFNPDGSLDNFFGNQGMILCDLGSTEDFAFDIEIQSDDKILVVGTTGEFNDRDFALIRLNADGTNDQSFGINGIVKTSILYDDELYSVALQTDGKIVVGGIGNSKGYIFRFLNDGILDTSFGSYGKVTLQYGAITMVRDITLLADGTIIAVGQIGGNGADGFATKINTDGSINTAFGANGKFIVNFNNQEYINSVYSQNDGKILLGGAYGYMNGSNPTFEFLILRLTPEGILDNSFSTSGKTTFGFGLNNAFNECNSIVLDANNNIFAIGYTNNLQQTNSNFALAKLTSNGSLELTFGNNGKVISDFGSSEEKGHGALIDDNERLLVSGVYGDSSNPIICRYKTSIYDNIGKLLKDNIQVNVFPNPCKDFTTIELKSIKYHVKDITLYEMSGKEIQKFTSISNTSPTMNFPTHFLLDGVYQMKINCGNMFIFKTLIKQD
jgi:uncharacterized delta-60 repeat protein